MEIGEIIKLANMAGCPYVQPSLADIKDWLREEKEVDISTFPVEGAEKHEPKKWYRVYASRGKSIFYNPLQLQSADEGMRFKKYELAVEAAIEASLLFLLKEVKDDSFQIIDAKLIRDKDANCWVAIATNVDNLSTYGNTVTDTKEAFRGAVEIYYSKDLEQKERLCNFVENIPTLV